MFDTGTAPGDGGVALGRRGGPDWDLLPGAAPWCHLVKWARSRSWLG